MGSIDDGKLVSAATYQLITSGFIDSLGFDLNLDIMWSKVMGRCWSCKACGHILRDVALEVFWKVRKLELMGARRA